MKIGVAGQGAFGVKHLEAIANIPGIEVITLTGGNQVTTQEVAQRFRIPHFTGDLAESLAQPGLEAMILTTPTQLHASQTIQCLRAGKHVQVEIPMSQNYRDAEEVAEVQRKMGLIAMAGHTRRFSPAHQYVYRKLRAGGKLRQFTVQTHFNRRTNINLHGVPRSWTDHLLWHHACHTVDLFQYMTGETAQEALAVQGPFDQNMQTPMDIGVVMKTPGGSICTLSLSFSNVSKKQGTTFRYICDGGTWICYYDDLTDGDGNKIDVSQIDVSMNGVELQDREFFAAIAEGREPNSSVAQVLPAMKTLDRLERFLTQ